MENVTIETRGRGRPPKPLYNHMDKIIHFRVSVKTREWLDEELVRRGVISVAELLRNILEESRIAGERKDSLAGS